MILKNGCRIAVIGGGPAGSFFVHFVRKFATERGLDLSITIFDGKDFLQRGPGGCNLCAGVIAGSLEQKLIDEGISVPKKRIINRVDGYCLRLKDQVLYLSCEENLRQKIATVFRGNGPRFSNFPENISFDDFLLTWAQDAGAEVVNQPVREIELPARSDPETPAWLFYGPEKDPFLFEADLIVGAFGINTHLMEKIRKMGFGYRPPSLLTTYQAELNLGSELIQEHFGNTIHVFMPSTGAIRYATVIPKEDFVTITLIGRKNADHEILDDFFRLPALRSIIAPEKPSCQCFPRIAISPSHRPFADRLVIIGDASFSRHYKNGIESAFITAELAASTVVNHGIDSRSFARYYLRQARKQIVADNRYGRLLFAMNDLVLSIPLLSRARLHLAKKERKGPQTQKMRKLLWYTFTGNISYREIFWISFDFKLQLALVWTTIRLFIIELKNAVTSLKRRLSHDRRTPEDS